MTNMNGPPDTTFFRFFFFFLVRLQAACLCEWDLYITVCACARASRGKGGVQSSTPEALSGVEAWGWPEGTARLEEPLAGQQLNKRWKGSVSLEGLEHWEAQRLNAEDKQMLGETGKRGRRKWRATETRMFTREGEKKGK